MAIKWFSLLFMLSTAHWATAAPLDLQPCAKLESQQARLGCFDQLAASHYAQMKDSFATPKRPEPHVDKERARTLIGAAKIDRKTQPTSDQTSALIAPGATPKTVKAHAQDGFWFTVNQVVRDGERRQIFYMSDGQVWREIEPGRIRFPKNQHFEVLVNQGRMGDYRLRLEGKGTRTRVIRLR